MVVGEPRSRILPHGRAKAGPYSNIRPAEAGGGRYAVPIARLPTTISYTLITLLPFPIGYIHQPGLPVQ